MSTTTVHDLMTTIVVTTEPDTTYKDLVDILTHHAISALPVVDDDERVTGVVDNLTWGYDDSTDVRRRYVFDAQVRS